MRLLLPPRKGRPGPYLRPRALAGVYYPRFFREFGKYGQVMLPLDQEAFDSPFCYELQERVYKRQGIRRPCLLYPCSPEPLFLSLPAGH